MAQPSRPADTPSLLHRIHVAYPWLTLRMGMAVGHTLTLAYSDNVDIDHALQAVVSRLAALDEHGRAVFAGLFGKVPPASMLDALNDVLASPARQVRTRSSRPNQKAR